jgi:hypothetical protein
MLRRQKSPLVLGWGAAKIKDTIAGSISGARWETKRVDWSSWIKGVRGGGVRKGVDGVSAGV